jgi:hypothetical protein
MKKFTRLGMRYKIASSSFKKAEYKGEKVISLEFVVELKVFNTKTNREIVFISNKKEKTTVPVLKYIDKLENTEFDVQKFLFISEFINASYENQKIDIKIKNKELEKYGYRLEYEITEFFANIVSGQVKFLGVLTEVTTEIKLSKENFNELLRTNNFIESDKLMLNGTKSYEVDIK